MATSVGGIGLRAAPSAKPAVRRRDLLGADLHGAFGALPGGVERGLLVGRARA